MMDTTLTGRISSDRLLLDWCEAPWDSAIYGSPVLQITNIETPGCANITDAKLFVDTLDQYRPSLVSCRLPANRLRESMFLEDMGFRFVEMLYHPEKDVDDVASPSKLKLNVSLAVDGDMDFVREIARTAFHNERFHVDPRLDPRLGDTRYEKWACNALNHPHQRLHVLRDESALVSFFVTELLSDGTCFWHLNAVAPAVQGKGYGRRAWLTMVALARAEGARRVRSSIVARNHRVLNLYAALGFRFPPPLMTFHWVRSSG